MCFSRLFGTDAKFRVGRFTTGRVRQIEAKALRKLRQTSR